MEKVYCVHCGAALDVYARFCRNCGEKTPISPAMIRLAMDKDQQAICELYERTYQDVYHTIKSVVHDEDTALDILQDAYIKGFESLGQLNDPRSFLPWMKRIAINRAKNELKRKKPMLFTDMENEDGDELPFQDEREEHLPDIVIDKQETTRLINEMLATLSEEQRMVIGMFYYEQMSVKEIAAELGCSENTVKSRLNYGRKKIETQVLDLEKRGTKLYSLSPVLFLLLLFRNVAGQTADIPAQQILSNIQGSVAAQTAAQAGSAAGQEAARTGAKAADEAAKQGFLHTVAGKVVAGIAAVALIGGAVGGAVQLAQNNIAEAEPVNAAVETETAAEQDAALEQTEEITHGEEIVPDVQPEEPEVNSTELAMEAYTEYLESVLIPEKGILETEQSGVKSFPDMPAEEPPWFDSTGIYAVDYYDYDHDELPEMLVVYGNANAGISLDLYDTEDEAVVLNFPLKKTAEEKTEEYMQPGFDEEATQYEEPDSIPDVLPEQTATVSGQNVKIVDEEKRETPIRYIGEIFSTYIIIEYGSDRVMFIDKHAAHERLIYERLKGRQTGLAPQLLLEPVSVTLEKDEAQTVLDNREMLLEAGFEVDCFGERTILLRSVPVMMETVDITESFQEIADYLCKHKKLILSEKMEWIYANTACRAAIKGGNKSHPQELIELVMTLENNPEIRYCPHGRPIYFFMKKYEIEKMFGRLG